MRERSPRPAAASTVETDENERVGGVLFVVKDGYGFLRQPENNYLSGPGDVYVPKNVIQRWRIRPGSLVDGALGRGRRGKKKRPLEVVFSINGRPPEEHSRSRHWKEFTASDPSRRIRLETKEPDLSLRVLDLLVPIGFGARALISGPPRTGKTVLVQRIANALAENHPDARAIILLVDERPEEITDYRRTCPKAEVIATSLEHEAADHVTVSEVALDRARRIAETGVDVVLFIDSVTRLARAWNMERGRSARTGTGGLDPNAMQKPREIFASARVLGGRGRSGASQQPGSLTLVATALAETESKLDGLIFDEFKGTANLELALSSELSRKRLFPAIDIRGSGTRKEEKLRDSDEQRIVTAMRRSLVRYPPQKALESLLERLKGTANNAEFLVGLAKSPTL